MAVLKNRAKMSTSTTGTGTITLGSAESGYQTFGDAGVANADVVRYVIEDGTAWEIGTGTYTATGTTLTRTVSESSNADAAIVLTGSAVVFVGATAEDILQPANNLSDLASAATARTNLGLGTAATTAATAYATAAQGTTADAALPKAGGNITGNLGIGSTVPDKLLVVQGVGAEIVINDTDTTDTPTLRFRESGSTSGTITTDASEMIFRSGATERMRITSTGIDVTGNATGQLDSSLGGFFLPQNPEGTHVKGPTFFNDISYARLRNATVSVDVDGTAMTNTTYIDAMLNADGDYWYMATAGVTTATITITDLPKGLTWGSFMGITFGNPNWRANSITLEHSTDNGSTWTTARSTTSNTTEYFLDSFNSSSTATNALRWTLEDFAGGSMRVVSLFAYNYSSSGMAGLYVTRDGGDIYNDLSFSDNVKATFGSDLEIHHNGTDSFIDEKGTGWLYIRGNNTVIGKYTGEIYMKGIADGAVELYHNNVKKLDTTSTGIDVTGTVTATSSAETVGTITTGTIDLATGNVFADAPSANATYVFSNPAASGLANGFTLKITPSATVTITWPTSVDWAAATAPDAPASGATNVYSFYTQDGGTTYYGFLAGGAMA